MPILFVKHELSPLIRVVMTAYPRSWIMNAIQTPGELGAPSILSEHPDNPDEHVKFLDRFASAKRGGDFYEPTLELMAYIGDVPPPMPGSSAGGRPCTVSDAMVKEMFRDAWEGGEADSVIAARYGVSPMLVSMIARGATRRHLFKTEVVDGRMTVRERGDPDAPVYSWRIGRGRRDSR